MASLSPAPSFSLDSSATVDHSSSLSSSSSPSSSSHDDFSFNVIPLDNISFPADHLFSHGGLLPINQEPTIARSTSVNVSIQASPRPFTRSKSTGSNYMTQSRNRNRNRNLGEYDQKKRSRNAKDCYYYSGSEGRSNGVRISPVINVRMRFIPRGGSGSSSGSGSGSGSANNHTSEGSKYKYIRNSFFSYLLCNCRGENGKELVCGGEI